LKGAWFQPSDLSNEKLVSNFAFTKFYLYRYNEARRGGGGHKHAVGLYKLNSVDP
jgi:hypothetical protein